MILLSLYLEKLRYFSQNESSNSMNNEQPCTLALRLYDLKFMFEILQISYFVHAFLCNENLLVTGLQNLHRKSR